MQRHTELCFFRVKQPTSVIVLFELKGLCDKFQLFYYPAVKAQTGQSTNKCPRNTEKTPHFCEALQGFGVAQLCLLLWALTRGPSPPSHLLQRLTAEIVFRRRMTESDCAVGGP